MRKNFFVSYVVICVVVDWIYLPTDMVHLRKVPYLLLIKPPDLLRRYFLQFLLERLLRIH